MAALPPGPRMSRAAQTAAWTMRPGPFMLRAQREFGDAFTIKVGTEPPWVMLAHPDAVREVFTGDPAVLHAGKANVVLRPMLGRASVLLLDGPQRGCVEVARARADRAHGVVQAGPQAGRRAAVRADPRAPRRSRRRRALAPARSPRRGRRRDERRGAARRARHAAGRRTRDDRDRALLGRRAAGPHAGRLGGAPGGRRATPRRPARRRCGCGRHGRRAVGLPRAPPARTSTPTRRACWRLARRRTPRPRGPAAGRSRWCPRAAPRSS